MRIGLQVPSFNWSGGATEIRARLAQIARAADDGGFASLWVMDHFFQIHMLGPETDPMLEGYSALSYLAAVTERVRLGTLVTGVIYRHPGILVKTVSTLDVLSGGRAYFGVGASWYEREARGLGVPFPSLSERFQRLEETLQIAKQMWTGQIAPYQGRHYELAQTLDSPHPLTKPHPPILIGGMGEKKTLRLVARYGDACNLFLFAGIDALRAKLDILKRHCDEVGRPYDEIERTVLGTVDLGPGGTTPSRLIETCRELAAIGVQHAIFNLPNVHEIAPLETFAREIIPAVSAF
jgi:F420-dependent oxidoreductase-like protein